MAPTNDKTPVPDKWDATHMPSLQGKTAIVTGANSGIGFVTALELARKGAHVVLACRNAHKGADAAQQIADAIGATPGAGDVQVMELDVSSLASVQRFADAFKQTHARLDVLVNNAGIMAVPFALTVDGVESQFATNHLGHFALTAQLFPVLKASAPARIVNVSSAMHRRADRFDEDSVVTSEAQYSALPVYAKSKLANILFTKELARRTQAAGIDGVTAVACHPGVTATSLQDPPKTTHGFFQSIPWRIASYLPIYQPADMGALPTLCAATAPFVKSGDFIGPNGWFSMRGYPALEQPSDVAESTEAATALWTVSERLAQLSFEIK